jgi:hypothetical protein
MTLTIPLPLKGRDPIRLLSLAQIAAAACLPGNFDDLVAGLIIHKLRREIPRSFYRAEKQLRRDDRNFRNSEHHKNLTPESGDDFRR